jgi:hypothetical protein
MRIFKYLSKTKWGIVPIGGFIIVVVIVFGNNLIPPKGYYLFGWDTWDYVYYALTFFHKQIQQGVIPWWNPNLMSGYPFMAAPPGVNLFYPLNWLFVFFDIPQALSLYIPIHVLIAMIGMYLLCRLWMGKLAAWVSGIIFALSGFFMPRILTGEPNHIASASFLPFVFRYFWMSFEDKTMALKIRHTIIMALFLGIELLIGDPRIAMFAIIGISVAAVLQSISRKKIFPILLLILAVILAFGFSGVQTIPFLQFAQYSSRGGSMTYTDAVGAISGKNLISELFFIFQKYVPDNLSYPVFNEGLFYTGISSLILAFAGILLLIKNCFRGKYSIRNGFILLGLSALVLMVISVWIALGPNAPVDIFYPLWNFLPFFNFFRLISRISILFIFAVAILAAIMVDSVNKKLWQYLLIILVLVELIPFSQKFLILTPVPEVRHDSELTNLITAKDALFRFHPNIFYTMRLGYSMDLNEPDLYGNFSTSGYTPLILKNYFDFYYASMIEYDKSKINGIDQMPAMLYMDKPALDYLNVKYFYDDGYRQMYPNDMAHFQLVLNNSQKFFQLFENKNVLPRFFMVPQIEYYTDEDNIADALKNWSLDLSTTLAFINPKVANHTIKKASCLNGNRGDVQVLKYEVNKITLMTQTLCDAYLDSSEVMYPGWEAYIDGKKTKILEGNLSFRTVYVPAGKHTIVMEYQPVIFLYGFLVSLLSVLSSLVIVKYFRKHIK